MHTNQSYSSDSDSDFSFEPANKYPRLSSREYQSPNKDQRDKVSIKICQQEILLHSTTLN
ncbi:hypothetical protein WA026_004723 [Henosepilachna vigintioctopunctata]|uniref:Uncharacterized protein n=1 Tax=Henosepilachna vigintioctopunctata TaxID=420089 RepID=A0AAW1V7E1_9CUCU